MTREFHKQRRYDQRPSYHDTTSTSGDERFARGPRPRLNRAIVDRAWQNGANRQHPDYRLRSSVDEQQGSSGTRRYGQRPDAPPQRGNHPNGNRPYRQERSNERPPYTKRFERDEERYQDNRQRGAQQRPHQGRPQSFSYEEQGYRFNSDSPMNRRGYNSSSHSQNGNPPTVGRRRPMRELETPPHYGSNGDNGFARNSSNSYPPARSQKPPYQERFEGDYESFNHQSHNSRFNRSPQGSRTNQRGHREEEERHVTRLPDGRVLKGSRPVQRRQARFWNDVTEDTQQILEGVHQPPTPPKKQSKPAAKAKSKGVSEKVETETPSNRKKAHTTTGPVLRPSQRGFKWPSAE